MQKWLEKWPDASIHLMLTLPGEKTSYPASTRIENGELIFLPGYGDTQKAGHGAAYVAATRDGTHLAVSETVLTEILLRGRGGETIPEAPEAQAGWVADVLDAAHRAEEAAKRAENAQVTDEQVGKAVEDFLRENPVEFEEKDPTVPGWAKEPEKPTYTADEVGAQPKGDYTLKSEIPAPYTLPVASADTLGGVKVGEGVQMDGEHLKIKPQFVHDLINKMCIPFTATDNFVTCLPVSDYPLGVISHIEPKQEGSGDPSPDNVRPIVGWTEASLTRTGKNLFDQSAHLTNDETLNRWYYKTLKMQPNTTYTMSCDIPTAGKDYVALFAFNSGGSADGATNQVYKERPVQITTLDDGIIKIQYRKTSADYSVSWYKYQIELGETATEYAPYQGNQFTAQFGQTIYGGSYDWNAGKLIVTHNWQIFNGEEDWEYLSIGVLYPYFAFKIGEYGYVKNGKYKCSHFANDDYLTSAVPAYNVCCVLNSTGYKDSRLIIRPSLEIAADLTQWKTYLAAQAAAGTPVVVVYELETPITIQLTPQQILSLDGENNLWSDCGETTVNGPNSPKVLENRIAALEAAMANLA